MTKVQIHFKLIEPLSETLMSRISDAHSIYGIMRVRIDEGLDGLTVDFDASRLKPVEVEAALAGAGIPVQIQRA